MADINCQTREGRTPLMLAAMGGHVEMVDYLLGAGADPGMRDVYGRTALDYIRLVGDVVIPSKLSHQVALFENPDESVVLGIPRANTRRTSHRTTFGRRDKEVTNARGNLLSLRKQCSSSVHDGSDIGPVEHRPETVFDVLVKIVQRCRRFIFSR